MDASPGHIDKIWKEESQEDIFEEICFFFTISLDDEVFEDNSTFFCPFAPNVRSRCIEVEAIVQTMVTTCRN